LLARSIEFGFVVSTALVAPDVWGCTIAQKGQDTAYKCPVSPQGVSRGCAKGAFRVRLWEHKGRRDAAMTIEIHRPELEALIRERMKTGAFQTVEDALMEALNSSQPSEDRTGTSRERRTGADLIAALQASPYREIEIEPARYGLPVRDVTF
jgi:hypothetical protein